MPPRAKFTKEEIINAGLEILRASDLSLAVSNRHNNFFKYERSN